MRKEVFFFVIVFLFSCTEEPEVKKPMKWTQEDSTRLHQDLAAEQSLDIDLFLAQHSDWKMTKTGSGLQYYIYEKSTLQPAKVGDLAQVEYTISLLDGTVCYKTNSDEYEEFRIDKADIESGVQEGVKLLRKGEKAKFIIPSHLAHGLTGDMNKIPPLTVIVVDFHLLDLL